MALLEAYSSFQDYVVTKPSPCVAQVAINRSERHNAFTERMWKDFGRLFDQISHDPEVKVVILSGIGKHFTVGLDLEEAISGTDTFNGVSNGADPARKAKHIRRYIGEFQHAVSAVERCEKPVICLLHGLSYGIAIDIASCADIRICSSDAKFAVKEVDVGLAADLGTLSRLPKIVGNLSWVKHVSLTAREFGAQEALYQGFVSETATGKDAALQIALEIAKSLASKSPVAVQSTKEILNHARDYSVVESLRYTTVWNSGALQTKDVPEAIEAWREKRKAGFAKL